MLDVHILCVGKLKEKFYTEAAAEYVKRLGGYCRLTLTELPEERLPKSPSRAQIDAALEKEAAEGKLCSSEELAKLVSDWSLSSAKHLVFLIGSSYGLHPSLKAQAWVKLSMSPMTFPHHLARVMLLEQVYRAFKINEGSDYHK